MISERLFYFIHGLVTAYFIMAGLRRFKRQGATRLEHLCGVILLYWALLILKDLVFYPEDIIRYNYVSNLLIIIDMTAASACGCFLFELLNPGWFRWRRALLLSLPFLIFVVSYAIVPLSWIIDAAFIFLACYSLLLAIYVFYAVQRYNRMLSENYSNIEYIHVGWLNGVVLLLILCLLVWVISCYFSSWIMDSLYYLLLMCIWIVTLHYADRQKAPNIPPVQPAPKSGADVFSGTDLAERLEQLLVKERVWMNPHLTLSGLAMQVGTNRTYLSNYLNNTLNTTFYDYINNFRLQAALEQMRDPSSTATMIEIAESSGFNSLSTFRRVFSKSMGCSFAEYRHRMGHSE